MLGNVIGITKVVCVIGSKPTPIAASRWNTMHILKTIEAMEDQRLQDSCLACLEFTHKLSASFMNHVPTIKQ